MKEYENRTTVCSRLGLDFDLFEGIYASAWKGSCRFLELQRTPLCCAVSRSHQFFIDVLIRQRPPLVVDDHIQGAFIDRMKKFLVGAGGQGKPDMGMRGCEALNGFLNDPAAETVQHAHPQPLVFTAGDTAHLPDGTVQGLHLLPGLLIEIPACRGDREFPPMPFQQLHLKFFLQCPDLLGDGGLGDMADFTCLKEAAGFHNGDIIAHLTVQPHHTPSLTVIRSAKASSQPV